MKGYIYSFNINNKLYIGKTFRSLKKRLKQHKYDAFTHNTQTPLYHAIRKYGWETARQSFKVVEEIEEKTLEELNKKLCERENYYMDTLNTMLPNGYNVHHSNHITPPYIPTREEKNAKISKALKGKYMNQEYSSRKVICEQDGIIYPSISEFARHIGVKVNNISHLHYGEYTLQYVDDDFDISKFEIKPKYDNKAKMNQRNKNIICIDNNIIYKNSRELSNALCGNEDRLRGNIRNACVYGWKMYGKSYRYYIQGNIVPITPYSKKNRSKGVSTIERVSNEKNV